MSKPYLISDGRAHGQLLGNLYDASGNIPDQTNIALHRIFAPVRQGDMSLFTIDILALQGAGKTEFCRWMSWYASQIYGPELRILVVDDLAVAYAEMERDPHTVWFVVVDDAAAMQSSHSGSSMRETFDKWFDIRHIVERATGSNTGRIVVAMNWQRMKSVHPNFRNPNLWCFLSPMADAADIEQVEGRVGSSGYDSLKDNWDAVLSGDYSRKGRAVVRFPEREIGSSGVGWLLGEYVPEKHPDWKGWPGILRSRDYFRKPEIQIRTREDVIEELSHEPELSEMYEIWDKYKCSGISKEDLAQEYKMSPTSIWRKSKLFEDMIEERMVGGA